MLEASLVLGYDKLSKTTLSFNTQTLYPPGRFNDAEEEESDGQESMAPASSPSDAPSTSGRIEIDSRQTANLFSNIRKAKFIKSSVRLDQCPPAKLPEFAVIGRSNVGKSSLINMLTRQTALAAVSKTPGEQREVCLGYGVVGSPVLALVCTARL